MSNNSPSVKRARPPVGWHKTVPQEEHKTTVWAWLKTVLMFKQPLNRNWIRRNPHYKVSMQLTRTLNVHEVRVGRLHKSLELVRALLVFNRGVKKINSQLFANKITLISHTIMQLLWICKNSDWMTIASVDFSAIDCVQWCWSLIGKAAYFRALQDCFQIFMLHQRIHPSVLLPNLSHPSIIKVHPIIQFTCLHIHRIRTVILLCRRARWKGRNSPFSAFSSILVQKNIPKF